MRVAKRMRMKNSAFRTLLWFADDKVKARHVCEKVARVRRRGVQVLCWLSWSKNVADSRVMFSRLDVSIVGEVVRGGEMMVLGR